MTCDDCLSLTLHKKLSNLPENVSLPRIDKKKLHTQGFQLKGISRNMRCKLLQKRSTGKTRQCSKHLEQIAIEKDFFSDFKRCIVLVILLVTLH